MSFAGLSEAKQKSQLSLRERKWASRRPVVGLIGRQGLCLANRSRQARSVRSVRSVSLLQRRSVRLLELCLRLLKGLRRHCTTQVARGGEDLLAVACKAFRAWPSTRWSSDQ